MTTKTQTIDGKNEWTVKSYDTRTGNLKTSNSTNLTSRTVRTITYADGPKYNKGGLVWKECHAEKSADFQPVELQYAYSEPRFFSETIGRSFAWTRAPSVSSPPSGDLVAEAAIKAFDQINLNCHDGVLLYSGVLQAVPLVGGAFRFVSLMNELGRKLSKDIKRRPFTTVLKSAISLDFINRFVVKPTMDDALKFLDASNYVLRVMNTVQERNRGLFALEGEASETIIKSSTSGSKKATGSGGIRIKYTETTGTTLQSKVFLLCGGQYNTDAIDPIKLAAARYGVTRPLESAWDLVPFSFVVDYFTRCGDFISALSDEMSDQRALRGDSIRIIDAWQTTKASAFVRHQAEVPDPPSSAVDWSATAPQAFCQNTRFSRTRIPYIWGILLDREATKFNDFINVDLSATRKRTLAQLFIQAKL